MSFECRLAFIVTCKPELLSQIKISEYDLKDYFIEQVVLVTESLEYEDNFEGPKTRFEVMAKIKFIEEYVYSLEYTKNEMENIFCPFESEIELFDKWWSMKLVDCTDVLLK